MKQWLRMEGALGHDRRLERLKMIRTEQLGVPPACGEVFVSSYSHVEAVQNKKYLPSLASHTQGGMVTRILP